MAMRNVVPLAAKYQIMVTDDFGNVTVNTSDQDYVVTGNNDTISFTAGAGECWIVFPSKQQTPLQDDQGNQANPVTHLDPGIPAAFTIHGKKKRSYKFTVIGTQGVNDPTIIVDN